MTIENELDVNITAWLQGSASTVTRHVYVARKLSRMFAFYLPPFVTTQQSRVAFTDNAKI